MDDTFGEQAADEALSAAIAAWGAGIDEEPESGRWWLALGLILEREAGPEEALDALAQAVAQRDDPDAGAWAAYQGARILGESLESWGEAETMASLGLLHRPTMVELHWLSAVAAHWSEEHERAAEWAQAAIALNAAEAAGIIGADDEYRHEPAHGEGPWDVLSHALAALGFEEAAEAARQQVELLTAGGADRNAGLIAHDDEDEEFEEEEDEIADALPETWAEVLAGPTYVLTLERAAARGDAAMARVAEAGFSAAQRVGGVDGSSAETLASAWATAGNPRVSGLDPAFAQVGGLQGTFLSHVFLWNMVVQQGLPFATIFEDDIAFPEDWGALAPGYYAGTPKRIDLLHLAAQFREQPEGAIVRTPVSTLAGYVITNAGARQLLTLVMGNPQGVSTLPLMIEQLEIAARVAGADAPLRAVAWNALTPRSEAPVAYLAGPFVRNAGVAVSLRMVPSLVDETRGWFPAVATAVNPAAGADQRTAAMVALASAEVPLELRNAVRAAQATFASPLTELVPVSQFPLPIPTRPAGVLETTPAIAADGDELVMLAPWDAEGDQAWTVARIGADGSAETSQVTGEAVAAIQLPQLLQIGERWLVAGVVMQGPSDPPQLGAAELDLAAGTVGPVRLLGAPERGLAQRWWAPFAGRDGLGFVARVAPTVIVDAGDAVGVMRLRSLDMVSFLLAETVAVSAAVAFGDGMLVMGRDVVPTGDRGTTLHRFLLLEDEGRVTMVSHPFLLPTSADGALVGMTVQGSHVVLALPVEEGATAGWRIPVAGVRASLVALSALGDGAQHQWPEGFGVPETLRWLATSPGWGD